MHIVKSILNKVFVFLIRKLHYLDKMVTKNEKNDNPLFYEDLTPVDNADEDKKYSDAIEWAVKNNNVKNIAVTGPYGSGKSSVLRTFEKNHKQYRCLNISLGSFKDDLEKSDSDDNRNSLIEKSLLQQIFYRVVGKEIPQSRFSRIKNVDFFNYNLKMVFLVIWLSAVAYVYNPEYKAYKDIVGENTFPNSNYSVNIIIFIIFGLIIIFNELFKLLSNLKLSKVGVNTAELKFNEELGASILNKHLDEILYFFEKTKFDIVVIEDLDRFDEVDIFIKLRELNTLINNADQIRRKIVFIYAIKDDVFKDTDRTKFFDFIIPVIPVINASNSGDILLRKLSASSASSIQIDFINDITLYIEDMRMLKNIYNEFVLYKEKLGAVSGIELRLDKLLGFIVYKNKYPSDFAQLNSNLGMVAKVFNEKTTFVNNLVTSIENNISDLKDEVSKIENEISANINDLRRI